MTINNSPIERIAIIVAMEEESNPIISKLKMRPLDPNSLGISPRLKLDVFKTELKNKELFLIRNGKDRVYGVDRVGTQAAALTTFVAIQALKPDTIISAGTVGGLKDSQIGDVYASNGKFVFCDRIISLPKFREYGTGYFNYLPISKAATAAGLKLGIVATGNSLDPTTRDLSELEKLQADVIDMEAAAVAEVAQIFDVRVIAVKSVTNFLNKELHTDFVKNYRIAVDNLAERLVALISTIIGKRPSELDAPAIEVNNGKSILAQPLHLISRL